MQQKQQQQQRPDVQFVENEFYQQVRVTMGFLTDVLAVTAKRSLCRNRHQHLSRHQLRHQPLSLCSLVLLLLLLLVTDPCRHGVEGRPVVVVSGKGSRQVVSVPRCPPVTNQSQLNSYLWTIHRRNSSTACSNSCPQSYLFGTIHVPYTRVWDYVPQNAKQAFRQSNAVHFELDLLDQSTVTALNACQLLPRGQSLVDVLPRDLYQRLRRHLNYVRQNMPGWMSAEGTDPASPDSSSAAAGPALYAAEYLFDAIAGNWERKRPVYVLLMVNSLTESDIRARGTPVLDLFLAQEASRAGQQRAAVELVEEHCLPLNSMNLSQVIFALNHTLTQYEAQRAGVQTTTQLMSVDDGLAPIYTADDLVYQYNCGDLNSALFSTSASPDVITSGSGRSSPPPQDAVITRQINDYFRSELIDKRNRRMAARIDRLLTDKPNTSFFFAFGAGHFLGNGSLIELLRSRGYDVRHTASGDTFQQITSWRPSVQLRTTTTTGHQPHQQQQQQRPVGGELPLSTSSSRLSPAAEFPVPHSVFGSSVDANQRPQPPRRQHRQRHDSKKFKSGRRRLASLPPTTSLATDRPHFNDLWVRIDSTSTSLSVESSLSGHQTALRWFTEQPLNGALVSAVRSDATFQHLTVSTVLFCALTTTLFSNSVFLSSQTTLQFKISFLF